MIVINIALIILGILYGVGSVTNFREWYYRHDYLAIALSVFTSILLVVAGVLNTLNWGSINLAKSYVEEWTWRKIIKLYNGVFTTNKDLIALEVTSIVNNNWCADWRYLNVIELTALGYKLTELQMVRVHYISFSFILLYVSEPLT